MGKKIKGCVSTRIGVFISGFKTKYSVDPGLQDTIVPIATAQMNALGQRSTASVYVTHDNRYLTALPNNLEYLNLGGRNNGLARRLISNEDY